MQAKDPDLLEASVQGEKKDKFFWLSTHRNATKQTAELVIPVTGEKKQQPFAVHTWVTSTIQLKVTRGAFWIKCLVI